MIAMMRTARLYSIFGRLSRKLAICMRNSQGQPCRRHRDLHRPSAIEDYLQWLDGNRKSASDARWRANALILPNLGDKEVARLTAKDLRSWQSSVARQGPRIRTRKDEDQKFREIDKDDPEERRRRRASANRVMRILKAALNYAWREGNVPSDKEWRRVEPFEGVEAARVRYLTIAEAQRLLNASEPAFRNLVQAALQTGARYSELASLTVADSIQTSEPWPFATASRASAAISS